MFLLDTNQVIYIFKENVADFQLDLHYLIVWNIMQIDNVYLSYMLPAPRSPRYFCLTDDSIISSAVSWQPEGSWFEPRLHLAQC